MSTRTDTRFAYTTRFRSEIYWTAGSGFGSFAGAYKMFEPDNLLQEADFNHAHNDWAEVIITGGLPFALILAAAILWFVRTFAASCSTRARKSTRLNSSH